MKVFVVENYPIMRGRLLEMLNVINELKVTGISGRVEEAYDMISKEKPDVVILDMELYEGSGLRVLKNIKSDYPDITTIVFTNMVNNIVREKCKQHGADHFFDKSFEFERLPEVLKQLRDLQNGNVIAE